MDRHVRWAPAQGTGLEHLRLHRSGAWIQADSVVIGGDADHGPGGVEWALSYTMVMDSEWRVRSVAMTDHAGDRRLRLIADGGGAWTTGDGTPLPQLDGCIDIDLVATPFTNTLPIRRLGLEPGESAEIRVAYLPLPDLVPFATSQRYTHLALRRWRFESLDGSGFTAEISTDANELVLDYPGLYRRVG
ncbi:putative glycolipid-binding domain-containing protein [Inquilinus sp.]|uniref:putative glycolipid-binding domain-containing protein n=1 Tax=Inquilinus sp. TaxID=1932117 RepID=UPI0031CE7627